MSLEFPQRNIPCRVVINYGYNNLSGCFATITYKNSVGNDFGDALHYYTGVCLVQRIAGVMLGATKLDMNSFKSTMKDFKLPKNKLEELLATEIIDKAMNTRTHEVKDITIEFGFNKTNGMYFLFTCGRMVKEGKKSKLEAVDPQTKLYTGPVDKYGDGTQCDPEYTGLGRRIKTYDLVEISFVDTLITRAMLLNMLSENQAALPPEQQIIHVEPEKEDEQKDADSDHQCSSKTLLEDK